MTDVTIYGDNLTLLALAREFNVQFLVISSMGQPYNRTVSNNNIFERDIPL